MRHGERRHDDDERPELAQRNDEACEEQQVIGAVENVQKPQPDE
jgi:hypothetical protein